MAQFSEANIASLIFIRNNLVEIAIPIDDKYGHVTSLNGALARIEHLITKAKE